MQANVGGIDKVARLGAGAVLVVLAATGTIGAWGWLGIVPLATGLIGWCPAYTLFGMNSCAKK
jgi:O-antigen ligase